MQKTGQKKQSRKLSARIILLVTTMSFIVAVVISVFLSIYQYRKEISETFKRIEVSVNINSEGLATSLWNLDSNLVQKNIEGFLNIPGVKHVSVTGESLPEISTGAKPTKGTFVRWEKKIEFRESPDSKGVPIGNLILLVSEEEVYRSILYTILTIFLTNLLLGTMISVVLFMILDRVFIKHLTSISEFVTNSDFTKKTADLTLKKHNSDDELDRLAGSVNKLKDKYFNVLLDVTHQMQALSEAKQKAEEAATAKSKFLSVMSHEIRTPLNSIIGIADLLSETKLTDEQKRYVSTFQKASNSLMHLVNDILDYSKLTVAKVELENVQLSLKDFLVDVEQLIGPNAMLKKLYFRIECNRPDIYILGDSMRLRQVILNLLSNAIKFTQVGGVTLAVIVDDVDNETVAIRFEIKDTGIGISSDKLEIIFDEFRQVDSSTTRNYGGTGLGLSISKKIINLMGGDLKVTSEVNKGSKFYFEIMAQTVQPERIVIKDTPVATLSPAGDARAVAQASIVASPVSSPLVAEEKFNHIESPKPEDVAKAVVAEVQNTVASGSGAQVKILIVDDVEDNHALIEAFLGNAPGIHMEHAFNGQEAVEMCMKQTYDLVFMDIRMPVMDGHTAVTEIRKNEVAGVNANRNHLPIIVISANNYSEDIEKSLSVGADEHLGKPVLKATIFAKIKKYAPAWESSASA